MKETVVQIIIWPSLRRDLGHAIDFVTNYYCLMATQSLIIVNTMGIEYMQQSYARSRKPLSTRVTK